MSTDAPAFCAWRTQPALPEPRAYAGLVVTETSAYVLGGYRYDAANNQVVYYDGVVRAEIQQDGNLSSWMAEPAFQNGRSGASATNANGCIFITGGSSSTQAALKYYDDVQYARIQKDGKLTSWTKSPHTMSVGRSNHTLLTITTPQGTFLQAIAGVTQIGADTVHLDTVETAKVGGDCSVGPWALADYHLKGGRSTPQALAIAGGVAVVGGWGDLDTTDVYRDVQTSSPRVDATPTPWRVSASALPTGLYGHWTVLAASEPQSGATFMATVGGQPGTGAYSDWIAYAYVFPGLGLPEAIGAWRIAPTGRLPTGRAGLVAFAHRSNLYAIGGQDAAGQFYSDVLAATFDAENRSESIYRKVHHNPRLAHSLSTHVNDRTP